MYESFWDFCCCFCLGLTNHLVDQTSCPEDVRPFDTHHARCNVVTFLVFLIMFSFYCGLFHVSVMIFCQYVPQYGQPAGFCWSSSCDVIFITQPACAVLLLFVHFLVERIASVLASAVQLRKYTFSKDGFKLCGRGMLFKRVAGCLRIFFRPFSPFWRDPRR